MKIRNPLQLTTALMLFFVSTVAAFSSELFGQPIIDSAVSPLFSVVLLLFSLFAFLHVGGLHITPAAMVLLAFTINLAFPSAYAGVLFGHSEPQAALTLALGFFFIGFWIWAANRPVIRFQSITETTPEGVLKSSGLVFLFSYPIVLSLFFYEERLGVLWRFGLLLYPVLFVSIAAIFFSRNYIARSIFWLILAVTAWALWYFFAFDGFGRINVAASLLGLIIVASWLRPSIIYKVGIVAAIIPGLLWAGAKRSSASNAADILVHGDGLSSVTAPFNDAVDILTASGLHGLYPAIDYLWQIVAGLFFWVPREWWQSKPEGFGRMLVYEFLPSLSDTGHSKAGSIFGEGIAFFGILGLMVGSLVLVGVAAVIERLCFRVQSRPPEQQLIGLALSSIAIGQILTLVWGGFFSFCVRALAPIFVAIAIWGIFLMMKRFHSIVKRREGMIYIP